MTVVVFSPGDSGDVSDFQPKIKSAAEFPKWTTVVIRWQGVTPLTPKDNLEKPTNLTAMPWTVAGSQSTQRELMHAHGEQTRSMKTLLPYYYKATMLPHWSLYTENVDMDFAEFSVEVCRSIDHRS